MTEQEFRNAVEALLARPVDDLSPDGKAVVVRECNGKSHATSNWLSPELQGQLLMMGLSFLALLARLDWWLLSTIWVVAASAFLLASFLSKEEPQEVVESLHITQDELRRGVHQLLAQPVSDHSVQDKAEVIQTCLVDMKQKATPAWWSRTIGSLPGFLLPFAGVATCATLFPGLPWYLWLLLGIMFGLLVALFLMLVVRSLRSLVRPTGSRVPAQDSTGEQAVGPRVDV